MAHAPPLADRISAVFVPAVIVPAAATFLGWWLLGADPVHGLVAAVAVLIVACPCALGLATPVAGPSPGTGCAPRSTGRRVWVGRRAMVAEAGLALPDDLARKPSSRRT